MAFRVVDEASLSGVADAIRVKGGTDAPLEFPEGFRAAIDAIPSGGSAVDTCTVTASIKGTGNTITWTSFADGALNVQTVTTTSSQMILENVVCGSVIATKVLSSLMVEVSVSVGGGVAFISSSSTWNPSFIAPTSAGASGAFWIAEGGRG